MEKSVIIVGAGIAGLSAGCYAALNGFRTIIFEQHSVAGGLCAAWKRKGYTFDISMHMLTGSAGGPFNRMWGELEVIPKFRFHYHDQASQIEGMGHTLKYSTNREELTAGMMAISPADAKLIREFTDLLFGPDLMNLSSLKAPELSTLTDKVRMLPRILPLIGRFARYGKISVQDFADRFSHPFLKVAVRFFIDAPGWPMPGFPMIALSGFMRSGITEAGTPLGGSQKVALHLAGLFRERGGEIRFSSRISDLILEDNRVKGVILDDGSEHRADEVIWAGDGHTLIFDILGGKYMNERIRQIYDTWIPVKSIVHVMLGVNLDLSAEPHRIVMQTGEPFTIGNRSYPWITVMHRCFNPSFAPERKSVVEVWYDTEYEYWEKLAKDTEAYVAEKNRIAAFSIAQLEKRWPGFASKVEVVDVPTPVTYHRYTGNWKGSPDGWYITTGNAPDMDPVRELPGLDGLQMIGQWTAPFTGTVMAALTGRQIIQLMCHKERRKFIPS